MYSNTITNRPDRKTFLQPLCNCWVPLWREKKSLELTLTNLLPQTWLSIQLKNRLLKREINLNSLHTIETNQIKHSPLQSIYIFRFQRNMNVLWIWFYNEWIFNICLKCKFLSLLASAATQINIRNARKHFERLEKVSSNGQHSLKGR